MTNMDCELFYRYKENSTQPRIKKMTLTDHQAICLEEELENKGIENIPQDYEQMLELFREHVGCPYVYIMDNQL